MDFTHSKETENLGISRSTLLLLRHHGGLPIERLGEELEVSDETLEADEEDHFQRAAKREAQTEKESQTLTNQRGRSMARMRGDPHHKGAEVTPSHCELQPRNCDTMSSIYWD
ncbi:unnamed protein product [Ophioblennius macclurei]